MSRHFSMAELTRSRLATERRIDNTPPDDVRSWLLFTMAGLERVRACLSGKEMDILSGYRSFELNQAVGGVSNSQHRIGQAADFVCPGFGEPKAVSLKLAQNIEMLGIDQLIYEETWVHVSFSLDPRCEALTFRGGKYLPGII